VTPSKCRSRTYLSFCSFKCLRVFLLSTRWDADPCKVTPSIWPAGTIYTLEWRETLQEWSVLHKNTILQPWPGLETGLLDQGFSVLNTSPLTINFIDSSCGLKQINVGSSHESWDLSQMILNQHTETMLQYLMFCQSTPLKKGWALISSMLLSLLSGSQHHLKGEHTKPVKASVALFDLF